MRLQAVHRTRMIVACIFAATLAGCESDDVLSYGTSKGAITTGSHTPAPNVSVAGGGSQSVVRIELVHERGPAGERFRAGAGVLLNDGRVVSAFHLLAAPGMAVQPQPLDVRVYSWSRAREAAENIARANLQVQFWPDLDLMQIRGCRSSNEVAPARLDQRSPEVGDPIFAFGTGHGQCREYRGFVVGRSSCGRWLALNLPTVPGDSGGPVFDTNGNVVGMIVGGGPNCTPFSIRLDHTKAEMFQFHCQGAFGSLPAPTSLALDLTRMP